MIYCWIAKDIKVQGEKKQKNRTWKWKMFANSELKAVLVPKVP